MANKSRPESFGMVALLRNGGQRLTAGHHSPYLLVFDARNTRRVAPDLSSSSGLAGGEQAQSGSACATGLGLDGDLRYRSLCPPALNCHCGDSPRNLFLVNSSRSKAFSVVLHCFGFCFTADRPPDLPVDVKVAPACWLAVPR